VVRRPVPAAFQTSDSTQDQQGPGVHPRLGSERECRPRAARGPRSRIASRRRTGRIACRSWRTPSPSPERPAHRRRRCDRADPLNSERRPAATACPVTLALATSDAGATRRSWVHAEKAKGRDRRDHAAAAGSARSPTTTPPSSPRQLIDAERELSSRSGSFTTNWRPPPTWLLLLLARVRCRRVQPTSDPKR